MAKRWLWLGIIVNALLFLPAAWMAASALNLARENDFSGESFGIAGLFLALPVFCLAVPYAAWRSVERGRSSGHTAALLLSPVVYAAFLLVLLLT